MNTRRLNHLIPRIRAQRRPATVVRRDGTLMALFGLLGLMARPPRR